ncbi:unnamed protein product [Rotaria magnacalcarata]|uniref:Uncharacterized protein n=1 Tax=Rotaria magnacalcarata TaxID=392030 RepID=A0A819STA0_9BILA|nr:unnamed protein product [Rotaria magnacalcarata]CAF4066288.1 unnamed protein product [Rotaria magnacalcarata]
MIIYDLDSLVGVNKSESDSSMDRSMSSSVANQSVDTYVRARFQEAVVENQQHSLGGNCIHHDGFIYDNSAPGLTIHLQSGVMFVIAKFECDMINYPERREEFERQKNKFKWIFCNATVITGSSQTGWKKGNHDSGEQNKYNHGHDGHRLDQVTIKRWEQDCRSNQEYNDKWLLLLEKRS